jgi:hypothetical protein
MKKRILSLTMLMGLFAATSAYAAVTTYTSSISIPSIGSTTYTVKWNAKTVASQTSYKVTVNSIVYYNGVRDAPIETASEYNTTTASISNSKTKVKSTTRGKWEILSEHEQYLTQGTRTDYKESYDYDYWDPNI